MNSSPTIRPGSLSETRQGLSALVVRIAAGDGGALEQFYDETSPVVYGLALRILGDRQAAEEVTLDVYAQLGNGAAPHARGRSDPLTWVLGLTRNQAVAYLRSRRRIAPSQSTMGMEPRSGSSSSDSTEGGFLDGERLIVREALGQLSRLQREVIELAYFEGLRANEIAVRLGLPVDAVENEAHLGLQKLSTILARPGGLACTPAAPWRRVG